MMTVKELKAHLEQFDESMEVIMVTGDSPWKKVNNVVEDKLTTIEKFIKVVAIK
jgi:hypothetical protein